MSPYYNLNDIREAAKQCRIEYRGGTRSNVRKGVNNLGYTLEDVANCIASLTLTNFLQTYNYPDQPSDDGYIIKVTYGDNEREDEIFMKLRLLATGEIELGVVDVGSFHLTIR